MKAGHNYEVTSEYLLAGLLIEGKNLAAKVLDIASQSKVNVMTITEALGIDPKEFEKNVLNQLYSRIDHHWKEFSVNMEEGVDFSVPDLSRTDSSQPEINLPDYKNFTKEQMIGPTDYSNYMIPGQIVLGCSPGYNSYTSNGLTKEINQILKVCDTFVCLRGEWSHEEYKKKYPDLVNRSGKKVTFLHFPIDDFSIAGEQSTMQFVNELVLRVRQGRKMYIHCQGGHGRTGLIAIQLFIALYGVGYEEAHQMINKYHDCRAKCWDIGGNNMPECDEQIYQIQEVEQSI